METADHQQQNPWTNLLINVALPVLLLKKLPAVAPQLTPLQILIFAILPPMAFGLWDFYQQRKVNFYALIGLVNVTLTGGFAALQLSGGWFILKEALLPGVIGAVCFASSFSRKPLLGVLLLNNRVLDSQKIQSRLNERGQHAQWDTTLRQGTQLFAASFAISAALNVYIARQVFLSIDPALSVTEQASMLNEQIAHMTWLGFVVIALPCLVITLVTLYWVLYRLSRLTGWSLESILDSKGDKALSPTPLPPAKSE